MLRVVKRTFSGIQSVVTPFCVNCAHFTLKPHYYINESLNLEYYKRITIGDLENGRCKYFANTNFVTGKQIYPLAMNCRLDEKMCGMNGSKFIKKPGKKNNNSCNIFSKN